MRVRLLASLLAATALVVGLVGPAAAAKASSTYAAPVVNWVQPTVIANADGSATVHVHYTCSGGNVGTHLFIALKQGPEVNATDHTSSLYANTFYSTNYNADGPGLSLNCNGRMQNARFVLKPDPYFWNAANAPLLSAGTAFVQGLRLRQHEPGRDGSEWLRIRLLDAHGRRELTPTASTTGTPARQPAERAPSCPLHHTSGEEGCRA